MAKDKFPVTQATRFLKEKKVHFEEFQYEYEEKGGTAHTSEELGVDEHCIIKTIVTIDENKKLRIILMHGDKEISLKEFARQTGIKECKLCDPAIAQKHTGYLFGGTSPFGTLKPIETFHEQSIESLEEIYINGGKRGYIIKLKTSEALGLLQSKSVNVAL